MTMGVQDDQNYQNYNSYASNIQNNKMSTDPLAGIIKNKDIFLKA
jgi:hypothetical protein